MNNILDFSKCANCGACYNICPTKAITVTNGLFYMLDIDNEKCVNCGVCKSVCPVNNFQEKQNLQTAYAGVHTDEEIIKVSSSGGAFSAIADYVLAKDGIVYGAAYSDDFKNVKICSTEETSLDNIRRSKYVESLVGTSFTDVKQKLDNKRMVLYCGAPCQIAGLKSFLKKEYENLITCDFSCGGMPSNKIYKDYLDYISSKKLKKNISSVNFRPKIFGWMQHAIKIVGKNKKYSKLAFADPYFYCFLYNRYTVREYCYNCQFANNHYSDIILADFWRCKDLSKVKNDDTGLSLIISNSKKGDQILADVKALNLTVLNLNKASYNMKRNAYSDEFFQKRKAFLEGYEKNGFEKTVKNLNLMSEGMFKFKYYIKKVLKAIRL